MLIRLVASLARASARSLPSIFVWLGTECRVVRLPRWLKAKAESINLVVISGYVVLVCARILMAAIESECMIVSSCLSSVCRHARVACMVCSSAKVIGVWSWSLPRCLLLRGVCSGKKFCPKPQ